MSKVYLILLLSFFAMPAFAQEESQPFKSTPYPLPRFVSLGDAKVHARTGPGKDYPVEWVYEKQGLPVEIVLEYDHWRKIRDYEGQEGWVFGSLLSGRRTAIVEGAERTALLKKPREGSQITAYAEPGAILNLEGCAGDWCEAEAGGAKGFVPRASIWGVYEKENFD